MGDSLGLASGSYRRVEEHQLPWKQGEKYTISSPPGTYGHVNMSAYAWDFVVRKDGARGAEVLASVDGCIRSVKRDARTKYGGLSNWRDVNYVTLVWDRQVSEPYYPGKKIESLYMHLDHIYPEIKPGVCLKKGTPLGVTGCTGYCTGIHLHYQVQTQNQAGDFWSQSVPLQFAEMPMPRIGQVSTSQNSINSAITPPVTDRPVPVVPTPTPTPTPRPPSNNGNSFVYASLCSSQSIQNPAMPICVRDIPGQFTQSNTLLFCSSKQSYQCEHGCEKSASGERGYCLSKPKSTENTANELPKIEVPNVGHDEMGSNSPVADAANSSRYYGDDGQPINRISGTNCK